MGRFVVSALPSEAPAGRVVASGYMPWGYMCADCWVWPLSPRMLRTLPAVLWLWNPRRPSDGLTSPACSAPSAALAAERYLIGVVSVSMRPANDLSSTEPGITEL